MISRFNLDQKRLNFYENIDGFNKEFENTHQLDNSEEQTVNFSEPSVLINKENTLKISLIKNNKEFNYLLFSNHSISILPYEKLKVHKAIKDPSKYEIFKLKSE